MWDTAGKHRSDSIQKNWIPFVYERTLLFVQNIYPHRIVSISGPLGNPAANVKESLSAQFSRYASRISDDEDGNLVCYMNSSVIAETRFNWTDSWGYGPLRGGSQGIFCR